MLSNHQNHLCEPMELGWEKLSHPAHFPDVASLVFHLFCSLQNHLDGKWLCINYEDVQNIASELFASKDKKFYAKGINDSVNQWWNVIHADVNFGSN